MPPPQLRGGGGGAWPSWLVPGLLGCLFLGLFLTPGPFLSGGSGAGVSGRDGGSGSGAAVGAGGNNVGGSGAGGGEVDLLLRGKQTQRAAGVPPHQGKGPAVGGAAAQPASTEGMLRYFAEAHDKGLLSASALKEVELLVRSGGGSAATALPALTNPDSVLQEEIYWRGRQRREDELALIHHNLSAIRPFDAWGPIYIWDWFGPDYVCSSMERVGRVGDGGKWMCGLEALRQRPRKQQRPCVVYAFGVNDDTSFEEELVNRTGCQVFAFDPTVPGLPKSAQNVTPPLHFYKQALAGRDGPTRVFTQARSLYSVMRELGHDFIDVLKVDVEGAEWDAFAPLFAMGAPLPVGQLLIELHYKDVNSTFHFFQEMEKGGFRVFSRETNYHPCVTGKMPVAIEYSFLHPDTYWTGQPTAKSQQALAALPAHRRENGVIYLLTRRERVHSHLIPMLRGLDKHFNAEPGRHYPVIIFHDDFTHEDEAAVRAATTSPVTLRRVEFEVPAFLDRAKIPERTECSKHSSTVGYRHMCRFLGLQVQDLLDEYEWHWRLDDDSVFLGPIGYDPFRLMKENGKRYGFNRILHDADNCVVGLWDAAKAFASERSVDPTFLDNWDSGVVFYNNFEISHRSIWRDPTVRAFLDHIDRLGGIYYVRWGDAPIRSLAVALTLPETQLHFFSDVGYAHLPYHTNQPAALPPPLMGALWHLDGAFQYVRDVEEDKKLARTGMLARRRRHGVIVIFSDATRYAQLKRCVASLEQHFNARRGYHVWVWTHGLTYAQRLELRALSSAPVRIDNLEQPILPSAADVAVAARAGPCALQEGGRGVSANVTRLLGWEVAQRIAARYEWQWRLADDAVFTEDLVADPFLTMVQTKATYGVAAVRPTPAAARPCVRQLVGAVAARLRLEEEPARAVLDCVEGAYFDPGFEVSHRSLWEDERWGDLLDVVEAQGWVPALDEALIRSLGVTLVGEAGHGAVHIFDGLGAVNLSAALAPWQAAGTAPATAADKAVPLATQIGGYAVANVTRDPEALGNLFRPQRLGFLDAELGAPVTLPRPKPHHAAAGAAAAVGQEGEDKLAAAPDLVWMLGRTRIGYMNNSRPVPAFELEDAAALLATGAGEADFFWRFQGGERMPVPILNDGTIGHDEALFPTAGLAVLVPEKGQHGHGGARHGAGGGTRQRPTSDRDLRLVLLCERRNTSEFVEPGDWVRLGSALVVVSNARHPPSKWVYEVRMIPGTSPWSAWHTALALTTGEAVAADPDKDAVYLVGEQTTNVTVPAHAERPATWRLDRQQTLARVPLASLLRLSFDRMELLSRPETEGQGGARWLPYWGGVLEPGSQEGAEKVKAKAQPILPAAKAAALHAERVGMGYLEGPALWYIADLAPVATHGAVRLVLKTAATPMGPWVDHAVLTLPPEFASAQYDCPAVYPLPALSASTEGWEAALGLACLVRGHGARPVREGRSQLSAQAGPTAVDLVRVRLSREASPVAQVVVESHGEQARLEAGSD